MVKENRENGISLFDILHALWKNIILISIIVVVTTEPKFFFVDIETAPKIFKIPASIKTNNAIPVKSKPM